MIVKLSDILGFEDKSFQSIPKEELEAALRRYFAFLPKSASDTGAPPTGDEPPQGTTNPELLSQKHPAAVWYLLDALQRYDKLPVEKVREIALEVAQLGRNGLSYAETEKKYRLKSLPDEPFSGLQLMCFMFAGFKRVAPEHDVGMDLNEPFLKALQLFNDKRTKS